MSEDNLSLDDIAEKYVRLALQIGQYDEDFIDAYYGPDNWRPAIKNNDSIPSSLDKAVSSLIEDVNTCPIPDLTEEIARFHNLRKQCIAMQTKLNMIRGKKYSFDEEAELLYDIVPPHYEFSHFDQLLAKLDELVPGNGDLYQRYQDFISDFVIPVEELDTVFQTAIKEARSRTKKHFHLPENENFSIEYVKDKSWSGYNYYKGNSYSIIQINIDHPIYIERALDLACHEGYPGHHVYNTLLEKNLVVDKGWVEFSIYPLFSPQSFIAEGSANYGVELTFPRKEKLDFEKNVLYPLAGLDSSRAELYEQIQELRSQLSYAGNEAARSYLNGDIPRSEAINILQKYLLYEPERALQRIRFIDQYGSYVINYNLGQDTVANFIRQEAGMDFEKRWLAFEFLLSKPITASIITTN